MQENNPHQQYLLLQALLELLSSIHTQQLPLESEQQVSMLSTPRLVGAHLHHQGICMAQSRSSALLEAAIVRSCLLYLAGT